MKLVEIPKFSDIIHDMLSDISFTRSVDDLAPEELLETLSHHDLEIVSASYMKDILGEDAHSFMDDHDIRLNLPQLVEGALAGKVSSKQIGDFVIASAYNSIKNDSYLLRALDREIERFISNGQYR